MCTAVLPTGSGRRGPRSGAREGADADFAASETESRNDPGSGGGARAAPSGTGAAGPRESAVSREVTQPSISARIVKAVNVAILIALVAALALVYWYAWRPLPQRSGTIDLPV